MTKKEIQSLLSHHHEDFVSMIDIIDSAKLTTAVSDKWTPLQQLDHIYKGIKPIAQVMTTPDTLRSFNFGTIENKSRSYESIRDYYLKTLSTGVKASGRFIPSDSDQLEKDILIQNIKTTIELLNKNIEAFSEEELDQEVIPHPVLGKLSVREMLYFTIYHVQHHHKHTLYNLENHPTQDLINNPHMAH